jgi:hypothetical protein
MATIVTMVDLIKTICLENKIRVVLGMKNVMFFC